jgi:MFS family permease
MKIVGWLNLPTPLLVLASLTFTNFSGMMVLPLLSFYLVREAGIRVEDVGPIIAMFGVGSIAGAYLGGRISDVAGSRLTLAASYGTTGFATIAMYFAMTAVGISLLFFLAGLFNAGIRPAYNSCVIKICPETERGKAYALYLIAANAGSAVGGVFGGAILDLAPGLIFWVDGLTSLTAMVGVLFLVPRSMEIVASTDNVAPKSVITASPWRDHRFVMICCAVLLFDSVVWQRRVTFPIFSYSEYGFSGTQLGELIAVGHLIYAGLALPISAAVKRNDQYLIAGIGAFLACMGLAVMSLTPAIAILVALYGLTMLGEIIYYPAAVSIVMGRAAQGRPGAFLGTYHATQAIASVGGPLFGAWLYGARGPAILWGSCGIAGMVLLMFYSSVALRSRLALRSIRSG